MTGIPSREEIVKMIVSNMGYLFWTKDALDKFNPAADALLALFARQRDAVIDECAAVAKEGADAFAECSAIYSEDGALAVREGILALKQPSVAEEK